MIRKLILALGACLWASLAFGQANNDSNYQTPGNAVIGSTVQMCVNAAGRAVPCSTAVAGAAGFPNGATPITAVFSGADTTTAAATLAGAAGKTTSICGFSVTGLGSTAGGPVSVTVAGIGGNTETFTYVFAASATTANAPVTKVYTPCQPTNALNTAIVITVPGQAGNTATQINAEGFQQ